MAMAAMLFAPTAAAGSDVAVLAAALEEFCGQSTNAKAELLCNDADLGFRTLKTMHSMTDANWVRQQYVF